MLIRPRPLKKGDRVAITAPASPVSEVILKKSLESIKYLELEPVIMPSCALACGYLSGSDLKRANDINRAFADESIKGIFSLRGGYGATRLLPLLDFPIIKKNPKVFVGYSDITALHIAFNQLCSFVTFHGPMPSTSYETLDSYSLASLQRSLFSDQPAGMVSNPPDEKLQVIYPGRAEGIITGGNLSLLQATLGSAYEIDTNGKILLIEEVGEPPYRLDRTLTALSLAGKFRDCAGILLGTFADCEKPSTDARAQNSEGSLSLRNIFDEVIKPWGKPTLLNFRAGHVYPQNTIPMGTVVRIDSQSSYIRFLD